MTDRQAINRQNANSGPNPWDCPWCGETMNGSQRVAHIVNEHADG